MNLEIKDVVTYVLVIIGFVVSYWKSKTDLVKKMTQMTAELEDRKEHIQRLENVIGKLEKSIDKILDQRVESEKASAKQFSSIQLQLSEIVKEQALATTILTENLKHLTGLVKRHDDTLSRLKQKI